MTAAQPFVQHGGPDGANGMRRRRLLVVRSLRGDQIAHMQARRQITEVHFAAGRHYQALHEGAFATALRSLDLTRAVIDQGRHWSSRSTISSATRVNVVDKVVDDPGRAD